MACGKKKLRKRLKRLWESDPRCSWCGRPTVLMQGPENANLKVWPNNRATIDHLDHKFLGQRGKTTGPRTVLSCYRCNQQQNVIDIDHYTVQGKKDYTNSTFKKDFNVRTTNSNQNNQQTNKRWMALSKSN